jgi:hypothetical protein
MSNMEVEIHIKGHKFIATTIEEVDQVLKWFWPGKGQLQTPFNLKETSKRERGIPMDKWRKATLNKWGVQ